MRLAGGWRWVQQPPTRLHRAEAVEGGEKVGALWRQMGRGDRSLLWGQRSERVAARAGCNSSARGPETVADY